MQKPDDQKRQAILDTATRLFASRPFHEVRLDDVAAETHLGKGTLYVYFASKQELYRSVVLDGFDRLLLGLQDHLACETPDAWQLFTKLVRELVAWGRRYPHAFSLMRSEAELAVEPDFMRRHKDLTGVLEAAIRRGVDSGQLEDPRPDVTAQFLPACVRVTLRYGPADVDDATLADQILRVIGHGIRRDA